MQSAHATLRLGHTVATERKSSSIRRKKCQSCYPRIWALDLLVCCSRCSFIIVVASGRCREHKIITFTIFQLFRPRKEPYLFLNIVRSKSMLQPKIRTEWRLFPETDMLLLYWEESSNRLRVPKFYDAWHRYMCTADLSSNTTNMDMSL